MQRILTFLVALGVSLSLLQAKLDAGNGNAAANGSVKVAIGDKPPGSGRPDARIC